MNVRVNHFVINVSRLGEPLPRNLDVRALVPRNGWMGAPPQRYSKNSSYPHFEIRICWKVDLDLPSDTFALAKPAPSPISASCSDWTRSLAMTSPSLHDLAVAFGLKALHRTIMRLIATLARVMHTNVNLHFASHFNLCVFLNTRFRTSSADFLRDSFQISRTKTFNCSTAQRALWITP